MKRIASLILFVAMASTALAGKPNFIFILADDMGWTGTSVTIDKNIPESKSDFYRTPTLEELAKQGMRFSRAYSPGSLCTPSRAGILTGKTPAALHMTTPGGRTQTYHKLMMPQHVKNLPTSEVTIAEHLKENGYATAHFGKWHLGTGKPGEHGFDKHDGCTANEVPDGQDGPKDVFGITKRAIAFIQEQTAAEKPYYVQLSHYAVHTPIEAQTRTKEMFADARKGTSHDNAEYAAMTYDFDSSVKLLLSQIGSITNTYIIFMSDNGASGKPMTPQNKPLNGGKGSLYEGGIRVPLIISGPDIPADSQCDQPITGCDLLPTICELAEITNLDKTKIDGTSLVPLLTAQGIFRRATNSLLFHYPHYGKGPRQKPASALIRGDYKILKDLETGTSQIFNLKDDIGETKDLSRQEPERKDQLEKLLAQRLSKANAQVTSKNPHYDSSARPEQPRRKRR